MRLILFVITFFISSLNTYSYSWELGDFSDGESITQINQNIKNLDKNKDENLKNQKKFLETYKLDKYIKSNILPEEIWEIKEIAKKYGIENEKLEKEFNWLLSEIKVTSTQEDIFEIEKIKINILELKKDLYKNLTLYIDDNQYKEYLKFVWEEVKSVKIAQDLKTQIVFEKIKLNKKVTVIEEKIQENNEKLQNDINNLVEQHIKIKIEEFQKNEKFQKLSIEWKIKVLDITINKVQNKIHEINSNSWDIIQDRRKNIYMLIIKYISELRQEYFNESIPTIIKD